MVIFHSFLLVYQRVAMLVWRVNIAQNSPDIEAASGGGGGGPGGPGGGPEVRGCEANFVGVPWRHSDRGDLGNLEGSTWKTRYLAW